MLRWAIPLPSSKINVVESFDGLLFATVHVYSPPSVTFRMWVYCAVTGLSNTVSVPSVTVVESLVQVTVVAGPPVEIQVRVFRVGLYTISPAITTSPTYRPIHQVASTANNTLNYPSAVHLLRVSLYVC